MPDPMWKQIAEDLRQKIESGELGRDGKPLPTELELQAEYSASRNTVRDADQVARHPRHGLHPLRPGHFVTQKIDPFVTRLVSARSPQLRARACFRDGSHQPQQEARHLVAADGDSAGGGTSCD